MTIEPFEIHAPISGKVLRIFQESSQVINAGTPLLELGDTQNLEIEIDVLSNDAVKIQPGAGLLVEHWGGENPLRGIVRVIEPAAFTKISSLGVEEQRVNIIADFNEPPERIAALGDGYRVEASITIQQLERAILVPNSALFRLRREWHVLKVENEIAVVQAVQIGWQNESQTQVLAGLNPGEQVIVYPGDNVQAGSRIRFSKANPASEVP
jgi:HlyD family secretion protein